MSDFSFLKNPVTGKWVISAPRRSKRTNAGKVVEPVCPFCPGQEIKEEELYRIPARNAFSGSAGGVDVGGQIDDRDWETRVIINKFPFAPNHEVIIHSPDHHKNWDELPESAVELVLRTYKSRFNFHREKGRQAYIFHNFGSSAGASLIHPHTQLVTIPEEVKIEMPPLDLSIYKSDGRTNFSFLTSLRGGKRNESKSNENILETEHFMIFCPATSEWPDEVWIAPKRAGLVFGEISDQEIKDIGFVLSTLIQIFDLRNGHEFPYNFYIYPGKNWYLRFIPRSKIIGGFELGTNIIVNTQDPLETFAFIKEHYWEPNAEKIKKDQQADYLKRV